MKNLNSKSLVSIVLNRAIPYLAHEFNSNMTSEKCGNTFYGVDSLYTFDSAKECAINLAVSVSVKKGFLKGIQSFNLIGKIDDDEIFKEKMALEKIKGIYSFSEINIYKWPQRVHFNFLKDGLLRIKIEAVDHNSRCYEGSGESSLYITTNDKYA